MAIDPKIINENLKNIANDLSKIDGLREQATLIKQKLEKSNPDLTEIRKLNKALSDLIDARNKEFYMERKKPNSDFKTYAEKLNLDVSEARTIKLADMENNITKLSQFKENLTSAIEAIRRNNTINAQKGFTPQAKAEIKGMQEGVKMTPKLQEFMDTIKMLEEQKSAVVKSFEALEISNVEIVERQNDFEDAARRLKKELTELKLPKKLNDEYLGRLDNLKNLTSADKPKPR